MYIYTLTVFTNPRNKARDHRAFPLVRAINVTIKQKTINATCNVNISTGNHVFSKFFVTYFCWILKFELRCSTAEQEYEKSGACCTDPTFSEAAPRSTR